jgi:hypothetical protein
MTNISNDTFGFFLQNHQSLIPTPSSTYPGRNYNLRAIEFDDLNVDIFHDNDTMSKIQAIQNAKLDYAKFFRKSKTSNPNFNQNSYLWNSTYSPTMDPFASDSTWLFLDRISRAGIGHTYKAWDLHLQTAIRVKLSYYALFYTPYHGLCDLK